jgi:hypothetical protein
MTIRMGAAFSLTAACIAAACATPQPAARTSGADAAPVDATQLAALYAAPHREDGVVLSGAHAGAHWIKWAKPDGSLELSAAHGLFADSGRFVLKGDQVCAQWSHIDNGRETCMHLVKTGADTYTSYDTGGQAGSRFRVRPSDGQDE